MKAKVHLTNGASETLTFPAGTTLDDAWNAICRRYDQNEVKRWTPELPDALGTQATVYEMREARPSRDGRSYKALLDIEMPDGRLQTFAVSVWYELGGYSYVHGTNSARGFYIAARPVDVILDDDGNLMSYVFTLIDSGLKQCIVKRNSFHKGSFAKFATEHLGMGKDVTTLSDSAKNLLAQVVARWDNNIK